MPVSLAHRDADLDQPYARIRDAATLPEDPGFEVAITPRRGVCVVHRLKAQLEAGGATVASDGALAFIASYERAIAKGERPRCRCASAS